MMRNYVDRGKYEHCDRNERFILTFALTRGYLLFRYPTSMTSASISHQLQELGNWKLASCVNGMLVLIVSAIAALLYVKFDWGALVMLRL